MKRIKSIPTFLALRHDGTIVERRGFCGKFGLLCAALQRRDDTGGLSRGFTLMEMLMVIVIILLLSMVVATGVPAALKAYETALNASNAQLMLSTATTRLREELSVARPNTVKKITELPEGLTSEGYDSCEPLIQFDSYETGFVTVIANTNSGLAIGEYPTDYDGKPLNTAKKGKLSLIVPSSPGEDSGLREGSNTRLRVKLTGSLEPNEKGDVITIEGLKVVNEDDQQVAKAEVKELKIRTLAAPTQQAESAGTG